MLVSHNEMSYDLRIMEHSGHLLEEQNCVHPPSPKVQARRVPCQRRHSFPLDSPAAAKFPWDSTFSLQNSPQNWSQTQIAAGTTYLYALYAASKAGGSTILYTCRTSGQAELCLHDVLNWSATMVASQKTGGNINWRTYHSWTWCRWKEVPKSLQVQHIFCRSNRNFRILASGGNSIIQVTLTGSVIPVSCRVWLKMGHTMHNSSLAWRPQVLEQKRKFENFGFLLQYYSKINQRLQGQGKGNGPLTSHSLDDWVEVVAGAIAINHSGAEGLRIPRTAF